MRNTYHDPEILVLMSTYNGSPYLKEQIDTILTQENVKIKLLIRDDNSNDDNKTISILNSFKSAYPTEITIIAGKENMGYAKSFSKLLKIGLKKFPKIKFFAFADQDDVWEKDKLYNGIQKILNLDNNLDTRPILYCSNTELVDKNLNHIGYYWKTQEVKISKEVSLVQSFATGCTFVFNKAAANLYVCNYSPSYPSAHDYFMYQTCAFFGEIIWDSNSYIKYRQHGNNMIGHPNFFNRIKKRIKNIFKVSHNLENQNREFFNIYYKDLSVEDCKLFETFISYRLNVSKKIKLMLNTNIRYTNIESNIIYFIKILLGRL